MKQAHQTIPWLQRFARFGYMCQGTVFILIGILALLAAFNLGGDTENTNTALHLVVFFNAVRICLARLFIV